jgi:hypothetical protein
MAHSSTSRGNTEGNTDSLHPPIASSSSSRPRSILNVSRASALSPSLSSHTPLNQLSTSPSNRSIMSNGNRTGASNGYSALNRLKRVASNASIASSSKLTQHKPASAEVPESVETAVSGQKVQSEAITTAGREGPEVVEREASQGKQGESSQSARETLASPLQQVEEPSSNATIKRPRSPAARLDVSTVKQARRKTWFGFGGGVSEDGDVAMAEAGETAKEAGDTQEGRAVEGDKGKDVEMEDAVDFSADQPAPSKSWVAWRGPSEQSTGQPPGQLSYTDTVRRYVSAASTQSIPWTGWPLWRSDAVQPVNLGQQPEPEPIAEDQDKASSGAAPQETHVAASPQPSLLGRWWPAWSAEQSKVEAPQQSPAPSPPTPAEQVKAEALARMGVKDAVLNEATRSTWINYFSSRSALPAPRVEDKDRGPEVMKIDFGPVKASTSTQAGLSTSQNAPNSTSKDTIANKESKPSAKEGNDNKRKPADKSNADPAPPASRPSTPLTNDKGKANQVVKAAAVVASTTKGKKGDSSSKPPKGPPPPNLLLPSFDDTFLTAPRSTPPSKGMLEKTLSYLFSRSTDDSSKKARKSSLLSIGASRAESASDVKEHEAQTRLPRMWNVVGDKERALARGCKGVKKVSIIGVHGWFSQGPLRNLFGEPTGTSIKFATMMSNAVKEHFEHSGHTLKDDQISVIALEADGQVADRVNRRVSLLP